MRRAATAPDDTSRTHSASVVGALILTIAFAIASFSTASAASGYATWYGPGFQGHVMYGGGIYDMYDPTTTACNIYPLGTWIKVTNPANGRSVVVQVRDRGAFTHALDLSYAAFKQIADPVLMEITVDYQVVDGPAGNALPPRAAPSSRSGRPAPAAQYVVQPGDTLDGIAAQYGLDPDALSRWNSVADPNLLAPGQTLRLTAPPAAPAPAAPPTAANASYVVQPGDSLLALAAQFGVSADRLAAANNLADPFPIVIGQTLVIPAAGANAAPKTYTVQDGDTLSGIAATFGVAVDTLQATNPISDPSALQVGTVLTIPGS